MLHCLPVLDMISCWSIVIRGGAKVSFRVLIKAFLRYCGIFMEHDTCHAIAVMAITTQVFRFVTNPKGREILALSSRAALADDGATLTVRL